MTMCVLGALALGLLSPMTPATATEGDTDRDGVLDGAERCPATPVAARVDQYGCTTHQLVLGQHRVITGDALDAIREAEAAVRVHPELAGVARDLGGALTGMDAARRPMEKG